MPDSHLKIILDLSAGATREGLSQLQRDLQGAGAATDKAVQVNNQLALSLANTQAAAERLAAAQRDLSANTDPAKTEELKQEVLEAQVALDKEAESATRLGNELVDLENSTTEVAGANEKAKFSFTELNSAIAIGRQTIQAIKQIYDATVGSTIKLADSVRDLSRTIGATPEEASKLIAAADDVFISTETLTAGMEAAIRKGVKPTIEGLGELSDQYLALPAGIERSKFMMDTFGRSGNDLAALMEKGSAGITALGDAAEKTGQVLSQEDLEATLEVKQATDDLGDSVQGLTIALSRGLIPGLIGATDNLTYFVQTMGEGAKAGEELAKILQLNYIRGQALRGEITWEAAALQAEVIAQGKTNAALAEGNENRFTAIAALQKLVPALVTSTSYWNRERNAIADANAVIVANGRAYEEAAAKQAAVTSALLQAGLGGEIQAAQQSYWDVITATTPEVEKLTAQIARYRSQQGMSVTETQDATTSAAEYELAQIKAAVAAKKFAEYTGDSREEQLGLQVAAERAAESVGKLGEGFGFTREYTLDYTKKIQEANGSLDELNAKQADAERQLELTTKQFVYQQLAADLDAASARTLAREMGLIDEASYVAAEAAAALRKDFDEGRLSTEQFAQAGDYLARAIASLTSKHIEITVDTIRHEIVYQQNVDAGPPPGEGGGGGSGTTTTTTNGTGHFDDEGNWVPDGMASGGPVSAGRGYWVGERGPEPFIPAEDGRVVSHEDAMAALSAGRRQGGGDTIIINDKLAVGLYLERKRQAALAYNDQQM